MGGNGGGGGGGEVLCGAWPTGCWLCWLTEGVCGGVGAGGRGEGRCRP